MAQFDIYKMVTDRIIEQLEKGIIPWHKPWAVSEQGGCISHTTGKPYSRINQYLLAKPGEWLTYKQIAAEGGKIMKGEHASFCIFWTEYIKEWETEEGEKKVEKIPVLKFYNVWHIDQTEGIKARYPMPEQNAEPKEVESIEAAEQIINTYVGREKLSFSNENISDRAFYSPSRDCIVVPKKEQYEEIAEYYSTTFHEMTHSTGHASRLARKEVINGGGFGSHNYSKEELTAEMGAAMLCATAGIDNLKAFRNSVAYIDNWLQALKNDRKMIVGASSKAEAAVKYILNGKEKNQ